MGSSLGSSLWGQPLGSTIGVISGVNHWGYLFGVTRWGQPLGSFLRVSPRVNIWGPSLGSFLQEHPFGVSPKESLGVIPWGSPLWGQFFGQPLGSTFRISTWRSTFWGLPLGPKPGPELGSVTPCCGSRTWGGSYGGWRTSVVSPWVGDTPNPIVTFMGFRCHPEVSLPHLVAPKDAVGHAGGPGGVLWGWRTFVVSPWVGDTSDPIVTSVGFQVSPEVSLPPFGSPGGRCGSHWRTWGGILWGWRTFVVSPWVRDTPNPIVTFMGFRCHPEVSLPLLVAPKDAVGHAGGPAGVLWGWRTFMVSLWVGDTPNPSVGFHVSP